MSILQVHLELADVPPEDVTNFEGEEIKFKVNVENGENPICFSAKHQHYIYDECRYKDMKLEPYKIVYLYRNENLVYGARKVEENGYTSKYSQDEITHSHGDLECYDKIILLVKDIKGDMKSMLSLANLDMANWQESPFRFKYCESYIALYGVFTVTLWSGKKIAVRVPDADSIPFICNKSEIHYRLKFKRVPSLLEVASSQ